MSETARPAERYLPTVGIAPIAHAVPEKVALEPLNVVTVGADETDGATRIVPIDRSRVKVLHSGLAGFFAARHQDWQVAAPVGGGLNMTPMGGHLGGLEFIAAIPAQDGRQWR